jgi:hypothetical protein
MSYLDQRDVNLLIDTPMYVRSGARPRYTVQDLRAITSGHLDSVDRLPDGAQILEVPVTDVWSVATILLRTNPRIDEAVASGTARLVPIDAS